MEQTIKFSILVPIYNTEKYIRECIESVLEQTYTNYELILVDDGSTDSSGAVCDEYAEQYPFIKVYHKENGGALSTRVYAQSKASGDFYIYLDSDDSLREDALEKVFNTIINYECDCVIYGFRCFNEFGKFDTCECAEDQDDYIIVDKRDLFRLILLNKSQNALWRKAVRANVYQNKNYESFYHISLGEDLLQSLEVLENSRKVVVVFQNLYNYRMNPSSITHTVNYEKKPLDFTVEEQMLHFLERMGVFLEGDYRDLRDYRIGLLVGKIRAIARAKMSFSQKKVIFQKIKESVFYSKFLSKGLSKGFFSDVKNHLFFDSFSGGHYYFLVLLENRLIPLAKFLTRVREKY